MAIKVENISELDPDKVSQNHAIIREIIQEDNPQIDVRRGVFDDLINYYSGALATINQENIDRLSRSQSLLEIENDPGLADNDIVDGVLSNFLVTRNPGEAATGSVTIVVSKLASVTIAAGAVFVGGGNQYTTTAAYVARTDLSNVASDTDRVMTRLSDGTYAFTIEVTATTVGLQTRLRKGTAVIPDVLPLNFIEAYATSDFVGGEDLETNEALLNRLQEGVSVKALSNRVTMQATLRDRPAFSGVVASSIIGMGDGEMLRDKHWIWPTGSGGRVDWYVQTQDRPQRKTVQKTAVLVGTQNGNGIWQFSVDRADAPGFYDVYHVAEVSDNLTTGGYTVLSDTRGFDLTGDDYVPDIATAQEAVYSMYQTAVIKIEDTETDISGLVIGTSTKIYNITLRAMPLIAEIQVEMGDRQTRNAAADLLIKAPVPCFVSLSFSVEQSRRAGIDLPALQSALSSYVNNLGFAGRLYAAPLAAIIQSLLPEGSNASNVDILGKILRPDGDFQYIRSSEVITIPDDAHSMVSDRTVLFYLEPEDIGISSVSVS